MIKEDIVYMVNRFHAIHRSVLVVYLSKKFNISEAAAEKAIHKAVVARACYEKGDGFIVDSPFFEPNSTSVHMSRAIRVAIEFMSDGETDFMAQRVLEGNDRNTLLYVQLTPSEEEIARDESFSAKLLQISYIPKGNEIVASQMLASVKVPAEMRNILRRVAIVEPGFRQSYVRKAGYLMFIRFGTDMYSFTDNDIIHTDPETRWDDVGE